MGDHSVNLSDESTEISINCSSLELLNFMLTSTTAVPNYRAEYRVVHYRCAIFAHFTKSARTATGRATRTLEERIVNFNEPKSIIITNILKY